MSFDVFRILERSKSISFVTRELDTSLWQLYNLMSRLIRQSFTSDASKQTSVSLLPLNLTLTTGWRQIDLIHTNCHVIGLSVCAPISTSSQPRKMWRRLTHFRWMRGKRRYGRVLENSRIDWEKSYGEKIVTRNENPLPYILRNRIR